MGKLEKILKKEKWYFFTKIWKNYYQNRHFQQLDDARKHWSLSTDSLFTPTSTLIYLKRRMMHQNLIYIYIYIWSIRTLFRNSRIHDDYQKTRSKIQWHKDLHEFTKDSPNIQPIMMSYSKMTPSLFVISGGIGKIYSVTNPIIVKPMV